MTLNSALKAQLQHEHDRLQNERDSITQTIAAQASAEIDRVIQQINAVLGDSHSAPSNSAPSSSKVAQSAPKPRSTPAKPESSQPDNLPAFDAANLKPEFKSLKLMEAVVKAVQSKQSSSIDELIARLYEPFSPTDLKKARMSVAIAANHGVRKGALQKTQSKPDRFSRA